MLLHGPFLDCNQQGGGGGGDHRGGGGGEKKMRKLDRGGGGGDDLRRLTFTLLENTNGEGLKSTSEAMAM